MFNGDIIFYARRSRASNELPRSESKKAKLEELSINIGERLTGRKPVSEQSERASGYALGFVTRRAERG